MDTPSTSMRNLARRLLALEAASESANNTPHEADRVLEKLGISLTRFAGLHAFTALLRRALALARADMPALENVKVDAAGRLTGLDEVGDDKAIAARAAITAHLLGLMATFIGEPLTLRLVRERWPDA